jgi:AcrR family transcriptional regulator
MARPKVALISRRKVLEAALAILDEEGLEGLTIRRLADVLGVNGASLYHHFDNKDDILIGVAELALADVRAPESSSEPWQSWILQNAWTMRAALLKHPALVPLIVSKRSLGMGARMLDISAARLMEEGVPSAAVMPLLDSLELFTIGSVIGETETYSPQDKHEIDAGTYPSLVKAMTDRGLTSDEIFDLATSSIVDALDKAVIERQARWLPAKHGGAGMTEAKRD